MIPLTFPLPAEIFLERRPKYILKLLQMFGSSSLLGDQTTQRALLGASPDQPILESWQMISLFALRASTVTR